MRGAHEFGISPEAEGYAANRPLAWEYMLFSCVIRDEIGDKSAALTASQLGATLGRATSISGRKDVREWALRKTNEFKDLVSLSDVLLNSVLPRAMGAPGEPGNADEIVSTAKQLAAMYREMLKWTAEVEATNVSAAYVNLRDLLAGISKNAISETEAYARETHPRLVAVVKEYEETRKPASLEMTLTLTSPDISALSREIRRLSWGW